MRRLPLALALGLAALRAGAACPPQPVWTLVVDGDGESDRPLGLAVDSNDNALVAGYQTRSDQGVGRAWTVAKVGSKGGTLWVDGPPAPAPADSAAHAVAIGAFDNVFAAGESNGQALLVKYGPAGSLLWSRTYGAAPGSVAAAVVRAPTGPNTLLAGAVAQPGSGHAWFVQAVNGVSGALAWSRTLGSPAGLDDAALALAADVSDSLYVAGFETRTDVGQAADWVVRKFGSGSGGTVLWTVSVPGTAAGAARAATVALAPDGTVLVAGRGFDASAAGNLLLKRYDPATGAELASYSYRNPSGGFSEATALAVDASGNVYVAGTARRDDLHEGLDWVALKLDPGFGLLWEADDNGGLDDGGAGLALAGGRILRLGFEDHSAIGQSDDWVLRDDVEPSPCPADVVGGAATPVVIYPNPVSTNTYTIGFKLNADAAHVKVDVYDLAFRRVYHGEWDDVPKALGGVVASGGRTLTQGMYLVHVVATLVDGSTQTFAPARLAVRR